ncbi:MAG TPA: dienelactone hydrolase family protein [Gemmatimonadaceae bacterium]|nr:dienelactone hydrolase family protein [Gemmatimonadaceae bacterium]
MSTTALYPYVADDMGVLIPIDAAYLHGRLSLSEHARGLVIIANGDGDRVYDATNTFIARRLADAGFGTLVVDLLTPNEAAEDAESSALRFHQSLLATRLIKVTQWVRARLVFRGLEIGYFASGLCAGAALASASVSANIRSVVCRGARVDLVVPRLRGVRASVLLLVGDRDSAHINASRGAFWLLPETARLEVLPNAGHLLDEPATLERVARSAAEWFGDTLDVQLATVDSIDGMLAGVP